MDERTLTIIKAMARGPACYDDNSNSICVYCDTEWDHINVAGFREIRHKPECPVILARTMLEEQGTPLNIYKVARTFNSIETRGRQYQRTYNTYIIATTLEEAIRESTNENIRNNAHGHKMHVEFVQELPLHE